MHVAGAELDRLDQDFVDQPDDGWLFGGLRKLGIFALRQIKQFVVAALCQKAIDRLAADAEVRLDPLGDFFAAGKHRDDRQARRHAEFVQRIEIEGIAGGDDQRAVVAMDRKERLAVDEPRREILQQLQIDLFVNQIDEGQPYLVGQRLQRGLFGHKSELHGGLVEAHSVRLRPTGLVDLAAIEQPSAEE